jgi:putative transposase
VPVVFGPRQTIWTWHRRMAGEGTWDSVLARLLAAADAAGLVDWAVSVDSTIARAHRHTTNIARDAVDGTGAGSKYTNLLAEPGW